MAGLLSSPVVRLGRREDGSPSGAVSALRLARGPAICLSLMYEVSSGQVNSPTGKTDGSETKQNKVRTGKKKCEMTGERQEEEGFTALAPLPK